jgi:hypothetical protein
LDRLSGELAMTLRCFLTLVGIAVVLTFAATASAAINTQIVWEVSTDNVHWSSAVTVDPGMRVLVRARVSYIGTGSPTPIALASLGFQPTLRIASGSLEDQGDTFLPFVNLGVGGNSSIPTGVFTESQAANSPTLVGRFRPWGRVNLGATNAITVHHDAMGLFRVSQLSQSHPISSNTGDPNGDGVGAIPFGQAYLTGRGPTDPPFDGRRTGIIIFRYAYTPGASVGDRVLVAGSPVEGMSQRAGTERQVYWWAETDGGTATIRGGAAISEATITVHVQPARCRGDFDCSGATTVEDLFGFLAAYFALDLAADFNQSGDVGVQDIFDFLGAYFAPCP